MIMLLHLTRVDDVMCFKRISFLFLVQKKRLEVNVGEKWNLLSIIVNIRKSMQYCLNENINKTLSKHVGHYLKPVNNLWILCFLCLKSLWSTEKYWFQNEFV